MSIFSNKDFWKNVSFVGLLFIMWSVFNFVSTYDSLVAMFGGYWAITLFATLVVLTDVAFVFRLAIPYLLDKNSIREDRHAWRIGATWAIVTFFDTFLTWFFMDGLMENNLNIANVPSDIRPFANWFPFLIAFMTWAAQGALLLWVSDYLVTALSFYSNRGNYRSKPHNQGKSYGGGSNYRGGSPQVNVQYNKHGSSKRQQAANRAQGNNAKKPEPKYEPIVVSTTEPWDDTEWEQFFGKKN